MMKTTTFLAVAFLVTGFAATVLAADPENGEQQYFEYGCYGCHGYNATGERPLVPVNGGILSSEALFLGYLRLRADQNPVNPKRSMPNYSVNTLSDETARDIYAYLLSLEDNPPPVEDIPAFQTLLDDAKNRLDDDAENR